jgi:hypothetical protein
MERERYKYEKLPKRIFGCYSLKGIPALKNRIEMNVALL